jgi:hypothetical protein
MTTRQGIASKAFTESASARATYLQKLILPKGNPILFLARILLASWDPFIHSDKQIHKQGYLFLITFCAV